MRGLSDGIRRIFKRRLQSRFSVTGRAMVLIAPGEDSERKVQVLDISRGGLAFVYDGPKEDLEDSGILQLLAHNVVFLEKVHFETASDVALQESEERYRRRGVRFKWMGVLDHGKLDDFIREVGTFKL
ncbi:MAG TPA: PilZ domain-containing protein [Syntrophales bacterium]|nr:PilZ domain-containing protein [Syntrophales bacterium]